MHARNGQAQIRALALVIGSKRGEAGGWCAVRSARLLGCSVARYLQWLAVRGQDRRLNCRNHTNKTPWSPSLLEVTDTLTVVTVTVTVTQYGWRS